MERAAASLRSALRVPSRQREGWRYFFYPAARPSRPSPLVRPPSLVTSSRSAACRALSCLAPVDGARQAGQIKIHSGVCGLLGLRPWRWPRCGLSGVPCSRPRLFAMAACPSVSAVCSPVPPLATLLPPLRSLRSLPVGGFCAPLLLGSAPLGARPPSVVRPLLPAHPSRIRVARRSVGLAPRSAAQSICRGLVRVSFGSPLGLLDLRFADFWSASAKYKAQVLLGF